MLNAADPRRRGHLWRDTPRVWAKLRRGRRYAGAVREDLCVSEM